VAVSPPPDTVAAVVGPDRPRRAGEVSRTGPPYAGPGGAVLLPRALRRPVRWRAPAGRRFSAAPPPPGAGTPPRSRPAARTAPVRPHTGARTHGGIGPMPGPASSPRDLGQSRACTGGRARTAGAAWTATRGRADDQRLCHLSSTHVAPHAPRSPMASASGGRCAARRPRPSRPTGAEGSVDTGTA